MTIEIYSSKKQHILYDADRLSQIDATFFQPDDWREEGRVSEPSGGRGQAFFIQHPDGYEYLLRHYRRGGLIAKVSQDGYLFTGLKQSRPFAEFQLTHDLFQAGLPVPQPLAARVMRRGLLYTGDLATLKIPDARPFADYLTDNQHNAIWQAVGAMIQRFHLWGLNHVDLNANNILVDSTGKCWLIDFDRCRKMPADGPADWQAGNLERLKRSIRKLTGENIRNNLWQTLLNGYKS